MSGLDLRIRDLSVCYDTPRGPLHALRHVDFEVPAGSITGIVGESGCGKSTLIAAINRLLAGNARVEHGEIWLGEQNLLRLDERAMRATRGRHIATVFQDPMTSLNPILTIGRQLRDVQHRVDASSREKDERACTMLSRVGIPEPQRQLRRYPHQLSGGMRQRVAIAMALIVEPQLLIADEPTTALDATLEVRIIHRLQQLQQAFGCSILFISHHLGVIAELCEQVIVMYAGEVVESGSVRDVFHRPQHPYTQRLLECDPALIRGNPAQLPVIGGSLPDLVNLPGGCVFAARCDRAIGACHEEAPRLGGIRHRCACHLAGAAA